MSLPHGDRLLWAMTPVVLELQHARAIRELVAKLGAGLEALGLWVGLLSMEPGGYSVRYLTSAPGGNALRGMFSGADPQRRWPQLSQAVDRAGKAPLFVDVHEALRASGPEVAALRSSIPRTAIVAPLHVRGTQWGALLAIHDALEPGDVPVLNFFANSLSQAIEVCEAFERMGARTAELELVHELAVSGAGADVRELCRRALATLCRTTHTNAAVLHRCDDSGWYSMVGEAYGAQGQLVEKYRRFTLPEPMREPLVVPVAMLPTDSSALAAEGFVHIALVPLTVAGRPSGVLTLSRNHDTPFTGAEVKSAEILGVQMATLLERARLYEELKDSYEQLGRAQQELVRHERLVAVGELSAVMAHEMRNPLGVIFNSLATIKRLWPPEGDAALLLGMVGEEADRLNRIVGDLLDFVRPWELTRKPSAVEPIIANAIDAAAQAVLNANVRVVTEFTSELPPFPLDGPLLKQALTNLIVNAAQAMPHGGTILVRAITEEAPQGGPPWLVVAVRDEGVGLTERASSKLFQPFFTTRATGTGLGLAVVKRIVDSHMGEVTAKANDDGPGTTFTVRLPPTHDARDSLLTPPQAPRS